MFLIYNNQPVQNRIDSARVSCHIRLRDNSLLRVPAISFAPVFCISVCFRLWIASLTWVVSHRDKVISAACVFLLVGVIHLPNTGARRIVEFLRVGIQNICTADRLLFCLIVLLSRFSFFRSCGCFSYSVFRLTVACSIVYCDVWLSIVAEYIIANAVTVIFN